MDIEQDVSYDKLNTADANLKKLGYAASQESREP
jgi:hypothetical protein